VEGSEPSAPNNQDTLSHDPSAVRAVLSRPDGRLELVSTPRLIRAEGAHSTIRATFDLAFEGNTFNQQYAPGDLHADAEPAESDSIFSFQNTDSWPCPRWTATFSGSSPAICSAAPKMATHRRMHAGRRSSVALATQPRQD